MVACWTMGFSAFAPSGMGLYFLVVDDIAA
jgi:hypothetical protein